MRYNIGNTELKLVKGLLTTPTAVFAKLEYENPTGSHKDRMYLAMIEELERRKKIRKGMTLVDYSSGNGGASLAYIAGKRGYKAFVVVPSQMSKEKIDQIKKLGGEVKTIHSNANYGFYAPDDMLKARIEAARIGQSDRSRFVFLDQGENPMNAKAFESLGKEIVNGLKMKQVKPDAFVCGIGTGGTLTGVGRVLRKTYRDKIKVFGVEPHESRTIFAALHKQKATTSAMISLVSVWEPGWRMSQ